MQQGEFDTNATTVKRLESHRESASGLPASLTSAPYFGWRGTGGR